MALQVQTQIPNPNLNQFSKRLVVGGYDTHGTATSTAIAKSLNIPLEDLIVRFPDTSPENLPKLLYAMNLFNAEVYVVDIAINLKDPMNYINTIKIIADNNNVTFIDHHESNLKFLSILPRNLRFLQFPTAGAMAKSVAEMFGITNDWELLLIGVIGDRDESVKELIDIESMDFNRLYNLANVMDVLVRKSVPDTIKGLYLEGLHYLEKQATVVDYPPYSIVNQLVRDNKITKLDNILFADVTNLQPNMSQWLWKTFDEALRRFNADYLVAVAKVLDRQINRLVDVVFVVRYWLSELQQPKALVSSIIGNRRVIGHDTAFSISATSEEDAKKLAQDVISALQSSYSVTASYIPASTVAKAIQHDFRAILEKQTEILQTLKDILDEQRKNYEKYLELKERQVAGVEKLLQSSNTNNTRTLGAD